MSDARSEISEQFLTDAQRDALQEADNTFTAAAIQQAGRLLTVELGLSEADASPVLSAITEHVNGLDDVLDKRKAAKKFTQLRRLFGSTIVPQTVQLQAVVLPEKHSNEEELILVAPTEVEVIESQPASPSVQTERLADLVPKSSSSESATIWDATTTRADTPDDEELPSSAEDQEINTAEEITPVIGNKHIEERVARFLVGLFGAEYEEKIKALTTKQTAFLATQLVPLYEAAPQGRAVVNKKLKKAYRDQFEAVLNGETQHEVADKHGIKLDTLSSNLSSVRSVIKQDLSKGEIEIIIDSIPPAEPLDGLNRTEAAIEVPAHLPEAIKLVANALNIDDRRGFAVVNRIFNMVEEEADNSLEAQAMRKMLRENIEVLSIHESLPANLELDALENKVLHEILGDSAKPPLTVNSVKGKMKKELVEAKRNIEDVLKAGLTKVAMGWESL